MTKLGSIYSVGSLGLCKVTEITKDKVHFDILGQDYLDDDTYKLRRGWYARFYWEQQLAHEMIVDTRFA